MVKYFLLGMIFFQLIDAANQNITLEKDNSAQGQKLVLFNQLGEKLKIKVHRNKKFFWIEQDDKIYFCDAQSPRSFTVALDGQEKVFDFTIKEPGLYRLKYSVHS